MCIIIKFFGPNFLIIIQIGGPKFWNNFNFFPILTWGKQYGIKMWGQWGSWNGSHGNNTRNIWEKMRWVVKVKEHMGTCGNLWEPVGTHSQCRPRSWSTTHNLSESQITYSLNHSKSFVDETHYTTVEWRYQYQRREWYPNYLGQSEPVPTYTLDGKDGDKIGIFFIGFPSPSYHPWFLQLRPCHT
jgi:hypothetical protein